MLESNRLLLTGMLQESPVFSHTCCGVRFCQLLLSVSRKSGTADLLPVIVDERRLPAGLQPGCRLALTGQLRAYSARTPEGVHLRLKAFAQELSLTDGADCNTVELSGRVLRPPVFRTTPLGREIADLLLLVERSYGKADRLPVIAWGRWARTASCWQPGDPIFVTGRFQSRRYLKQYPNGACEDLTAYEVSASQLRIL